MKLTAYEQIKPHTMFVLAQFFFSFSRWRLLACIDRYDMRRCWYNLFNLFNLSTSQQMEVSPLFPLTEEEEEEVKKDEKSAQAFLFVNEPLRAKCTPP